MKFLIDAQLPRRLAEWLTDAGYDTVHTLDLPNRNRTPDTEVCAVADRDMRVVVTKDADFVSSYLVEGRPAKLLLVSTGNISNGDLLSLMQSRLSEVVTVLANHHYVEITRESLVIHE